MWSAAESGGAYTHCTSTMCNTRGMRGRGHATSRWVAACSSRCVVHVAQPPLSCGTADASRYIWLLSCTSSDVGHHCVVCSERFAAIAATRTAALRPLPTWQGSRCHRSSRGGPRWRQRRRTAAPSRSLETQRGQWGQKGPATCMLKRYVGVSCRVRR